MKKIYLATLLVFLLLTEIFAQSNGPAIAWGNISYNTYGSVFKGTTNANNFFTLEISEGAGNRNININKYSSEGLLQSRRIYSDGCSACSTTENIPSAIFASPDGGVIIYYELSPNQSQFKKIAENGDVVWERTFSGMKFVNATVSSSLTLSIIMEVKEGSLAGHYFLYKFSTVGTILWLKDLVNFKPTALASVNNDGLIATSSDSTKRYTDAGFEFWKTNVGGDNLLKLDDANVLVYNTTGLRMLSTDFGNVSWEKTENNIVSVAITSDKSVVFSTLAELKKLNSNGLQVWQQSSSTISKVFAMQNGEFATLQGNSFRYYAADGTSKWNKLFTYNNSNSLVGFPTHDGGVFVLTKGNSPNSSNLHGTAFLYRILPDNRLCDYSATRTPTVTQTACKTGTTTFVGNQTGLDLNYGLPTSDYQAAWLLNNSQYTTALAFNTADIGEYQFMIKQGDCTVKSLPTEFKVIGNQKPTVSSIISELCLNTVSAELTATGCPSTAKTLWSNNMVGDTVLVKPIETTDYTAFCRETYVQNNQTLTCLSDVSNVKQIRVRTTSNLQIVITNKPSVICKQDTVLFDTFVAYFSPPVKFDWYKDGVLYSNTPLKISLTEPGAYQLKSLDARGCTAETPVINVKKSELAVSVVGAREYCQGVVNTLMATSTGAAGEVSYRWVYEGGIVGQTNTYATTSSGNYSLTGTDSFGCTENATIAITQHPRILGAFKRNDIVKGNLLYNFKENTLTGGTPPFAITLSAKNNKGESVPVANHNVGPFTTSSTIYLGVKDTKGCTLGDSIKVNYVPCDLQAQLTGDTAFCYNKSIVLKAATQKGILPITYQWQKDNSTISGQQKAELTVNSIGTYKAIVSDSAQCVVTTSNQKISEKGRDLKAVLATEGDSTAYSPRTVQLVANTGTNYEYHWFKNDSLLAGSSTNKLAAAATGKYKVEILQNGCSATSRTISVTILIPLANENLISNLGLHYFPNPTSDIVQIKAELASAQKATIRLLNEKGQVIEAQASPTKSQKHEWQFDTSKWPSGIYHISVEANGERITGKLIKQ